MANLNTNTMQMIIKTYEHEGQTLNVLFTKNGFFNATAVAKTFGKKPADWLNNSSTKDYIKAISRKLDLDENQLVSVVSGGNSPGTWLHPKLGVYFARWCNVDFALWADEQIEAILKGQSSFQLPKTFSEALQLAADQAKQIEYQNGQIAVMTPKAEYYDLLIGSEELMDGEAAAKFLRTSRQKLFAFLKERGVLTKSNLPMQLYIDKDLMRIKPTPYTDFFGNPKTSLKVVFTQRGIQYIRAMFDDFIDTRDLVVA